MSAATVKRLDPTNVELDIEIGDDELERARERAFRDLARNVKMPGFRPGKVPRKLFESQYGTGGIEERALNRVVPPLYSRALKDNELDPVDTPQLEMLPEEAGQPRRVRATVAVRPHIALQQYTGIPLESSPTSVREEDVAMALEDLRKDAAVLIPVDRAVALGDVPTLDYEGTIDGQPFEGGQAEGRAVLLDERSFIPGFAAGIVGMSAGETKTLELRFPEDYSDPKLAGREAVFVVTVQENKVPELPGLDDDFAKRFGEGTTLGTLRGQVRNRLEAEARISARRDLTARLLERLLAAHDVPLPEVMVDRELEAQQRQSKAFVERAGMTWEQYLNRRNTSEDALRAAWRDEAKRRVKTSLLLEAIAKAENISATGADIEAEVRQLSEQRGVPREAILALLQENWGALVDGIVRTKTVEFLLERSNVLQAAGSPEEARSPASGTGQPPQPERSPTKGGPA